MQENEIDNLVYFFSKLPGVGKRSAKRMVLHLMSNRTTTMASLINSMQAALEKVVDCAECSNIDVTNPCSICASHKRDKNVICILESVSDLWALEKTNAYNGLYHILGGTLSSMGKHTPQDLNLDLLIARIKTNNISEVILATNATIDGQTTSFYIIDKLSSLNVKVSRIAQGIPIGGELEFLDEGTISAAFISRKLV
jgi:recombination protein RecR